MNEPVTSAMFNKIIKGPQRPISRYVDYIFFLMYLLTCWLSFRYKHNRLQSLLDTVLFSSLLF